MREVVDSRRGACSVKFLVTKIGSGKTPSGGAETYKESGVLFLRSQNIHFDGLRLSDVAYIDLQVHQEMRSTQLVAGDVLLNITGASLGRVSQFPAGLGEANVNQHVCILRPNLGTDSRYLFYALSAQVVQEQILQSQVGGNRDGLNFEQVGNLQVPAVPLEEQRRIADFLDAETARIDQLVALRREQLDLFAERYLAFVSEAVTPGIGDPSAVRSPSYPWLPGTLATARLGHFIKIQSGITVDGSRDIAADSVRRPYLRVANVQDGQIDLAEVKEIEVSHSMARRATLITGDVVITEANGNPDNLGRGAVWRGEIKGMVHQNHIFALRADRRRLMPEFLALTLASLHGRAYFRATSSQVGIATTSSSKIAAMPFPLTALPRQKQIIATCEQMRTAAEDVTQALRRQVELLEERRRAVVTAAVTGELDVTTVRRVS